MRAPTSAWRWKVTRPSGSITRVGTLPMSCSRADQRTSGLWRRLPHHLLGVLPDVLVAAPGLLREIDGGVQLGQERGQHPDVVQPLQPLAQMGRHDHRLQRARSRAGGSDATSPARPRAPPSVTSAGGTVALAPPPGRPRPAMRPAPAPNGGAALMRDMDTDRPTLLRDLLLVLLPLAVQVVDHRLGLLEPPGQGLLGDRVLGPEAQALVVQEGARPPRRRRTSEIFLRA